MKAWWTSYGGRSTLTTKVEDCQRWMLSCPETGAGVLGVRGVSPAAAPTLHFGAEAWEADF